MASLSSGYLKEGILQAADESDNSLHKNTLRRRMHFCSGRGHPESGIRRGDINSPSPICIFPLRTVATPAR